MAEIEIGAVEKVLDEKVRPGLALHGGNIAIESFEAGVLYVRLLGNCAGCLSADSTMSELVESEVKAAFPDIKEVSLVTGVSDDLIAQAKAILRERHK
ncbi:MAG: NifU family protein [Lachnospiraceae bacterium]|nr:NifU family protein [Lachnospiraceae bacterium]